MGGIYLLGGMVSVNFPIGSQASTSGDASAYIEPYRAGRLKVRREITRTKYKKYKRFIGTANWIYAGDEYRTTVGDADISIDYK